MDLELDVVQKAKAKTITVGVHGDYGSIQDGVNASKDGDTVYVLYGYYWEHVIVNKTIHLIGENYPVITWDWPGPDPGYGWEDDFITITSDGVEVNGFYIYWGGGIGIRVCSSYNTISNNKITLTPGGSISIEGARNNLIIDNTLDDGLYLNNSNGNNITGNDISNIDVADDGINLYYSNENRINDNTIFSCNHGIYLYQSDRNNITGNSVSSNSEEGIYLELSDKNNITLNDIPNNNYGIGLISSSNNNITNNDVCLNDNNGIYLGSSLNNNITCNNVSSNGYGTYLFFSFNNRIYHNNFINNKNQAYDNTNNGNQWDNGYPSGGNYWSDFDETNEGAYDDFKGPKQNVPRSDGIVDNGTIVGGGKNPYVIDGDSRDNYPLIGPYPYFPTEDYITLHQGWNLISIPLIQVEQNLIKVLGSIDGYYDAVQWYDATDAIDPWKHNKLGKPFGNDLTKINEKRGFWIHVTQPGNTIFFYNGSVPILNQTIPFQEGWNMVGYPSLTNKNRTNALNNLTCGIHIDSIWTFDAKYQKWEKIKESDYFEVGRGYWIHAKNDCVWEVPL
jgi:parallel beta-helix repeat protein